MVYLVDPIHDTLFLKFSVFRRRKISHLSTYIEKIPFPTTSHIYWTHNLHYSFFLAPITDNQWLQYTTDPNNLVANSYLAVANAHLYELLMFG
jgi:hypothetical protein